MAVDERIRISVVYAQPQRQVIVELKVAAGTSVAEAVSQSGLPERFPQIAAQPLACAIHGRVVQLTSEVHSGDRIEILRPLLIDPKEGRRQAAARAKGGGRRPA